ncbi:hypothetical protein AAL_05244 [Moelleriella libera RCEF 2490]|uniref:SnoaL-like domain-containing protein n=1 Tax=Moelleriella libera RCEF 2490 TaxID=1081109 RepID=A0A168AS85_9HYPO|nr:hypothetical protein AAL_05244 [Moelleriella libera RCEF 2490]
MSSFRLTKALVHKAFSHLAETKNAQVRGRFLSEKLQEPIKFTVTRVVVDAERDVDGWWCAVETRGEATRATGEPYNNEYAWLMRWNDEGKVDEIRAYFDTMLSEEVLRGPDF